MTKYLFTKSSKNFLQSYLNNPSPTGFESEGQKMWLDYVKPYVDDYIIDTYGTVAAVINPKAEYKVVIEAHADEISWFVHYITSEGYIYVRRNGGSDHQIAPSKRVHIHTDNGIVEGVFGWPAIHTRHGSKEEAPSLKNICLDVGAKDKDEVLKMGIQVGDVITYPDQLTILNDRWYVGRALDNRIGGYMIAEVARLLKKNKKKLPFGLYIVNAVQEEVGLRGAQMITHTIKPNLAIVTDVCHDTSTPKIDKIVQGDIKGGLGPCIPTGPAVQNNLLKLIKKAAKDNKIPFQNAAVSRATGTDTDAFAYSNGGVASALISLPLKYMHTTVESAHKDDIGNVIKLIYCSILNIKNNQDFRYFK